MTIVLLLELMEVDFSATSLPSRSLPLLEVIGGGSSVYRGHQSKLPIHRLTLDHAKLAGDVIESLGEALGVKQGAFVVDTLLSDVFEAWTARGTLSLAIMKQWAGSLFVATKVRQRALFLPTILLYLDDVRMLTRNHHSWASCVGVYWGIFISFLRRG